MQLSESDESGTSSSLGLRSSTALGISAAMGALVLSGGRLDRPAHLLAGLGATALVVMARPTSTTWWPLSALLAAAMVAVIYEDVLTTTLFPDPLDVTMGWFGAALGVGIAARSDLTPSAVRALRGRAVVAILVGLLLRWSG